MTAITRKSKRVLSVFSLVMINIIAIDSLRNLPANAKTGFTIAFFYLIGTVFFMIPLALISAELATHRPKAGGAYVWVREAFGEQWGFLSIWLQWLVIVIRIIMTMHLWHYVNLKSQFYDSGFFLNLSRILLCYVSIFKNSD